MLVACRMFQRSSNNNILPTSSWYYSLWALSPCKLWSLNFTIGLFPIHSCLTPLLNFLPFSSLPISSVGCLYVSETKQTESCVTQCSWETGGPEMSTAASSFVGHVRHSPDVSWRLSLCSDLTLCPCGREAKWDWSVWLKSIIFLTYSASMQNPRGYLQMSCFVWWTNPKTLNLIWEHNETIKPKFLTRWE